MSYQTQCESDTGFTGELGGRLQTQTIGTPGNEWVVERGANWVQGTQTGDGPVNPIWTLVQKHDVKTQANDWYGSVCAHFFSFLKGCDID